MLTIFLAIYITAYVCYRMAFYSPDRKPLADGQVPTPEGEIYDPYRENMEKWVLEARAMDRENVAITSFDGLTLRGWYYEYAPGAPIELMMHGYRGDGERDLSGGVQRCFACGRSALVIDQRGSGRSDGNTITMGILERRDCLAWVDFLVKKFGPDVKIMLTGISMGAATVVMAGGEELPENVVAILADCGYTSPKEIMQKVIREIGLPPKLSFPFVRMGAILFGHFDPVETSPEEAIQKCKIPVIFFHGETDDFVPCDMSRKLYDLCPTKKAIMTVPGAGHGLSYALKPKEYRKFLNDFLGPEMIYQR
jgi:pimeloyl-ACP methyl ester carboxylesterase